MPDDIIFKEDLEIKDGDWLVENSDQQGIEFIIRARPGHFYQFPTIGYGVDRNKQGSVSKQAEKQRARQNLEADGYRINKLDIGGTIDQLIISIDAKKIK